MKMSATTVRRALYGMFAGGLLGGVASAAMVMPTANASPETCTVSEAVSTSSTVSASTSTYLASHPEANQALTNIAKQPEEQAEQAFRAYFATNPQVENELKEINQPVVDLASECGIEVTPTPISEALKDL